MNFEIIDFMAMQLLHFSIVVLANDHNPTILNPDFLKMQKIIQEDWAWELATPPITTPPIATVKYKSGVSISVESNKLQVLDAKSKDPTESKITKIVERYAKVLPHVHYTAVGINFSTLIEMENADTYLKDRFLKEDPWESPEHPLKSTGLKLVYRLQKGQLLFSLDSAKVERLTNGKTKQSKGIVVNANFHRDLDLDNPPTADQIVTCLDGVSENWGYYKEILSKLQPNGLN